jgi:hypothetical protein
MYPKMKIDIGRGQVFEDYIEDYFKRRGWSVKRAKGNVPVYDMILTRGTHSLMVECKFDEMSDRTGNYCLEEKSLEQTQSDYLIIGTPNLAYILPIATARQLFNEYPKRQTGDFAHNFSALVPKLAFINFQRL